ncbi:hypothetical protein AXG93_3603s1000 [Marchantia polymorpha subsp. ruderalis]|uniref:Uncharacterized protein n=1 Tax=Marchantia polymorpha subsp. ruderalis TaxID=1480154 RepID=A0A176VC35_MARPO|nr:hypothetical protein AXG93_3603s1000 [Marchantia polymorpha subsp. ruderalis]
MTPFLVNFYRGMRQLTKNEEKQFSKKREVLELESDEDTEEENNTQAEEIPQGAADRQDLHEDPTEKNVEPLGERTATSSQGVQLSEMFAGVVRYEAKKRSLEEEPKELIVAFPDFLHDSVISLLKYLDGKQEKNVISKKARFYVELVKNRTHIKRATTVKTAEEMKRECAEAITKVVERVASLTSKCATMTVSLQEREEPLRAKDMECEVFRLNLANVKELRTEEELRIKDLWVRDCSDEDREDGTLRKD